MWTYRLRRPRRDFLFDVDFSSGETTPKLSEDILWELRVRTMFASHVWLKIAMTNVEDPQKMGTKLRMKILEQINLCTDDKVREQAEEWLNPTKTASKR